MYFILRGTDGSIFNMRVQHCSNLSTCSGDVIGTSSSQYVSLMYLFTFLIFIHTYCMFVTVSLSHCIFYLWLYKRKMTCNSICCKIKNVVQTVKLVPLYFFFVSYLKVLKVSSEALQTNMWVLCAFHTSRQSNFWLCFTVQRDSGIVSDWGLQLLIIFIICEYFSL